MGWNDTWNRFEKQREAVRETFRIPDGLLRGRKYFCSDCNEGRSCTRPDGRCPMCGGARIVPVPYGRDVDR